MDFLLGLLGIRVAYASVDSFVASLDRLIVNPLITFLFALALAYFLYGVLEFFTNQENEEKRTASKKHMLWGVIGLTIMMGVWTILGIILNTLNISESEINPEQGTVKLNDYTPPVPNNLNRKY